MLTVMGVLDLLYAVMLSVMHFLDLPSDDAVILNVDYVRDVRPRLPRRPSLPCRASVTTSSEA